MTRHSLPIDDEGVIRELIDHLGHDLDPSILIGGWATFELVGGEISKDIDLIIASPEVRAKVQARVQQLSISRHLGGEKWRGVVDGIHIDIYLPHQSELGAVLRLRVEVLAEHTEPGRHKGWKLLTIEAHTISKMAAILDRADSEKGEKDAGELVRLLARGVDADVACRILAAATAGDDQLIADHIDRAFRLISERGGANKEGRRELERQRRIWVDSARRAIEPERQRPRFE
ncbi:MAG: hypothetical protein Q8M65_01090 [Rhodoglobus sp.]|nr:hypothetical protein [Rhodoglobus sp.]